MRDQDIPTVCQHVYDEHGICFECGKPRLEAVANNTQTERNRRHREKSRRAGLVPVTVNVPSDNRDELRAIAAKMRVGEWRS